MRIDQAGQQRGVAEVDHARTGRHRHARAGGDDRHHTHLTFEATDDWQADELSTFKREPTERALEATLYARATLEAGFTTVRDLGSSDAIDIGLRNAIARGLIVGPRMLVASSASVSCAESTLSDHAGLDDHDAGRHQLVRPAVVEVARLERVGDRRAVGVRCRGRHQHRRHHHRHHRHHHHLLQITHARSLPVLGVDPEPELARR